MLDEEAVMRKYGDIINMPHHVSKKHPAMPTENRAAQFSPFAALTGYDDAIRETAAENEDEILKSEQGDAFMDPP